MSDPITPSAGGAAGSPAESPRTDAPAPAPLQSLRREAYLAVPDRGFSALLAGAIGMAGVTLGFGLALLAGARFVEPTAPHCRGHHSTVRVERAPVVMPNLADVTWLGVIVTDAGERGAPADGARIKRILPGSPAESAGLTAGSVIHSVDGQPIQGSTALVRTVRSRDPGAQIAIAYTDARGEKREARVALAGVDPWMLDVLPGRRGMH